MNNLVVLVVGCGGVGGWLGGKLIESEGNPRCDVHLVARGEHGVAIKKNGITIIDDQGTRTLMPQGVFASPQDFARNGHKGHKADVVILATKMMDLEETATALAPCLHDESFIIPLQNGIDAHALTKSCLPAPFKNCVGFGTVHIVSRIERAGVVRRISNFARYFFAPPHKKHGMATSLATFSAQSPKTKECGLRMLDDLTAMLWDKFIFLTAYSGVTSMTGHPLGVIRDTPHEWGLLSDAINEAYEVAQACGVTFGEEPPPDKWLAQLRTMPPDFDSSMAKDLRDGKPLELKWLSGRIVELGKKHAVPTPSHAKIVAALTSHA